MQYIQSRSAFAKKMLTIFIYEFGLLQVLENEILLRKWSRVLRSCAP